VLLKFEEIFFSTGSYILLIMSLFLYVVLIGIFLARQRLLELTHSDQSLLSQKILMNLPPHFMR